MDGAWRPATELERRMQAALQAGDHEGYFRLLADAEIVIPVPPELVDGVLAGRSRPTWPTQEDDGRTYVLAYTSPVAMRECIGQAFQHFVKLKFGDAAEAWPDARWWLAVDAGLPIESRLPSWFVAQVAQGDAQPPRVGRPGTPSDRSITNAAPGTAVGSSSSGTAPPGSAAVFPTEPGALPPANAPAGDPTRTAVDATVTDEAIIRQAVERATANQTTAGPRTDQPSGAPGPAQPAAAQGAGEHGPDQGLAGHSTDRVVAGRRTDPTAAGRDTDQTATGHRTEQPPGGPTTGHPGAGPGTEQALGGPATGRPGAGPGTEQHVGGPGTDQTATGRRTEQALGGPGTDQNVGRPGTDQTHAGRRAEQALGGPGMDQRVGGPGTDQTGAGRRAEQALSGPGTDQSVAKRGTSQTVGGPGTGQPAGGSGTDQVPPGGSGTDRVVAGRSADQSVAGSGVDQAAGGRGVDQSVAGRGGAEQGAAGSGMAGFRPAGDLEDALLHAIERDDHDAYVRALAVADVLLPMPADADYSLRPGRPAFPWQTAEAGGGIVVPVFTSVDRLREANGAPEFIKLPFAAVIRYWPDQNWPLTLNPGSPIGATFPGDRLTGLSGWVDHLGAQRLAERFEHQNDVEQRLFDASARQDLDAFFAVLRGAQVLLPADPETPWGISPGDPEFPWRPVPLHGATSVQVFTSLRWMNDSIGSSRFIMPNLQDLVRAWPDTGWTLVVNPGTPIDATVPGDRVRALADLTDPQPPSPAPQDSQAPQEPQTPQTLRGPQPLQPPQAPEAPQSPQGPPSQTPEPTQAQQRPGLSVVPPLEQQAQPGQAAQPPVGPASPPGGPGPHPGNPMSHPGAPMAQPGGSPSSPGAPESHPGAPMAQPGGSPSSPGAPESHPGDPMSQPGGPGAQPGGPGAEPGGPGAQPGDPMSQPSGPGAQPGGLGAQPSGPMSQPGDPMSQPGGSGGQPGAGGVVPEPVGQARLSAVPSPDESALETRDEGRPVSGRAAGEPQAGRVTEPEQVLEPEEPEFEPGNRIDQELYEAAVAGDTDAFLRVLLAANVLVPIPSDAPLEITPIQPEFRWDAAMRDPDSVQIFTSLVRLREVLPASRFVYADFRELIGAWPRADWAMLLNPGTRIGASLRGDQVRALSEWAVRVGLVRPRTEPTGPTPIPAAHAPPDTMDPAQTMTEPVAARPQPVPADGTAIPEPVVMQKVLPHGHVGWYLEQAYDRVGGFVHRVVDVTDLQTPIQLYEALGLLYDGSSFAPDDEGVYVIRWPAYCVDLYRIPFGGQTEEAAQSWGPDGWVIAPPPFDGTGFAPGSAGSIREYKVDSVRLPYGAEMYYLARDRSEQFVAMYDPDRLAWLRPEPRAEVSS